MNIDWKNAYISKKFRIAILAVFIVTFALIGLSTYYVTKHAISDQIQTDVVKQFVGVNRDIFTEATDTVTPITTGILEDNELVNITKDSKVIYQTALTGNTDKNLDTVYINVNNKGNGVQVKLFIDLDKRIDNYFGIFYKFVIPLILLYGLIITLFSIILLKKLTEKLNTFIFKIKEVEEYGVEFSDLETFETDDEVGILSRKFRYFFEELKRMYIKERQFVIDASHELKMPLSIIEGNLNLLDKRGYSPEGRSVAKELVMTNIYTAKSIVEDMLDLTHEEIIVKEKLEEINISEIALEIIDDYKLIYTNYIFKTDIDVVSYPVQQIDFAKLANVIIENAIKYSTDDLKEIEVKIKQKGRKIFFIVTDYGIGMNSESLEKVYDIFWRADYSRSKVISGVGLGLTVAQKICEKNKFKINIASELGLGTTVTVEMKTK